jgi:hypothetical protein
MREVRLFVASAHRAGVVVREDGDAANPVLDVLAATNLTRVERTRLTLCAGDGYEGHVRRRMGTT